MAKQVDQVFVQNFILILVVLAGMISVFVIIARTVGSTDVAIAKQRALVIADMTQPIGSVRRVGGSSTGSTPGTEVAMNGETDAATVDPGKKVYDGLCFSCHGSGLPNIPQVGVKEQWAERIAQGELLLYERALKGFTGTSGMTMPAKGGNSTLSDDDVKAAVDYMVANSK